MRDRFVVKRADKLRCRLVNYAVAYLFPPVPPPEIPFVTSLVVPDSIAVLRNKTINVSLVGMREVIDRLGNRRVTGRYRF